MKLFRRQVLSFHLLITIFTILNISGYIPLCFCYVIKLDESNFEDYVFHDHTPWIVGIKDKISENALNSIYEDVKDRINIGIIDEEDFKLAEKTTSSSQNSLPIKNFVIYPFGGKIQKIVKRKTGESANTAIDEAYASFPDITNWLPNVVDDKNTILKGFIQQAYSGIPAKFPVVLFTDESSTPLFYKLITLKFSSLFHFGLIKNPPPATQAVYAISKLPRFLVLLTELLKDGTPRIKPVPYDENIHGSLSYAHIIRFLYLVHKRYFKELLQNVKTSPGDDLNVEEYFEPHFLKFPELMQLPPGEKEKNDRSSTSSENDDGPKTSMRGEEKTFCSSVVDVCIFIVGKDLESLNNRKRTDDVMANLTGVKRKVQETGKTIAVFKIDIKCNEELEISFDIYSEDVPILLIVRPKKYLYTMSIVDEISTSLEEYMVDALSGKIGHRKYEKLPSIVAGICKENKIKDDGDGVRSGGDTRGKSEF